MTAFVSSPANPLSRADAAVGWTRAMWFVATAVGQVAFVYFIAAYYYPTTLSGDFAAWNRKPLIDGHISGDTTGNLAFAAHVLLAAVMTASGLLQLIPALRQRVPAVHRAMGRLFLSTAALLAIGGLYLVWVRGTYLTLVSGLAITGDAALILFFSAMTIRTALARDFGAHRRWALRTFMVANGVWMMRIGYVFWGLTTGGLGVGKGMSGPFDIAWGFGTYLLPLAGLEVYLWVSERGSDPAKWSLAVGLAVAAVTIGVGGVGAYAVMWGPYL